MKAIKNRVDISYFHLKLLVGDGNECLEMMIRMTFSEEIV
jgi:hypothetical protein